MDRRIIFVIFDEQSAFLGNLVVTLNDQLNFLENDIEIYNAKFRKKYDITIKVDGYFLSLYHRILKTSESYRKLAVRHLLDIMKKPINKGDIYASLRIVLQRKDVIDFGWGKCLEHLVMERQELDHGMAWLSTLGGAFSALGDSFEHCAKVAGKISVQQFAIALRLGEPPLVARCRLYMALSLIQLGKLHVAKRIIKEQYEIAKTYKDIRLQNMCKGVWSKLQYTHKLRKNG